MVGLLMEAADRIRNDLNLSRIDGFVHQAIKNDIYDSIFLNVQEDPWSTVLMHDKERYAGTHLRYSRTSEFIVNRVNEATGLSLSEFMKLPTFMVEYILSTLRQSSSENRREGKLIEQEVEQSFRSMKTR